jgi:hypothetical protein
MFIAIKLGRNDRMSTNLDAVKNPCIAKLLVTQTQSQPDTPNEPKVA